MSVREVYRVSCPIRTRSDAGVRGPVTAQILPAYTAQRRQGDSPERRSSLWAKQVAEPQTSLPLVIVRPGWVCAEVLVGQEDSGFYKSTAVGLRSENGHGTFLP